MSFVDYTNTSYTAPEIHEMIKTLACNLHIRTEIIHSHLRNGGVPMDNIVTTQLKQQINLYMYG